MTTRLGIPAAMVVLPICAALAVFIGYLLGTPTDFGSYFPLGLILMVLLLPWLLRWHQALLITCWNASFIIFFLPGQPSIGETMAFLSLGFVIWTRTMTKRSQSISVPSVSYPLIFLMAVVVVTALGTGGIRANALGSEVWGGKRYLSLFAAVAAYFAITSEAIPLPRAKFLAALYLLSGTTLLFSDLIYAAGPSFYFCFAFFPANLAYQQATTESTIMRLSGPGWAAQAVVYFIMMRYGVRGILDFGRPWRFLAFLACGVLALIGGFRTVVILSTLLFVVLFLAEGLIRTRVFLVVVLLSVLSGVFLVMLSDRLPLSIQRSLSVLPLDLDPVARKDAQSTLDWRLTMWKLVLPDVPKYFFFGKGFSFSATDFLLTRESELRGYYQAWEETLVSGNYHSGPLTTIVPFGIWGVIGFAWFCWAALRLLHRYYRETHPELRTINNFLLAYFWAKVLFFVIFYGQFDLDLGGFTTVVALSIAVNAGVKQKVEPAAVTLAKPAPALLPRYVSASGQAVGS